MTFPSIDPVAFQIGPVIVRWYALAYVAGLLAGWQHAAYLIKTGRVHFQMRVLDDLFLWVLIGIIFGGRLGYVVFYQWNYYLVEPLQILAVWRGGMSFHGALIGVGVALLMVARRNQIAVAELADAIAPMVPLGLMFGRLANFVNGELYGRKSDVYWSLSFPRGGEVTRHPSQLYEALLEGFLLLLLMVWLTYVINAHKRVGFVTGAFLVGYGCARIAAECFREPDQQLGFFLGVATLGQLLSFPMILLGLFFVWNSKIRDGRA